MNSFRNDPVWLVEWPASDNMPARWWDCVGGWMLDANKATHFSREQDAAGYITTAKMVVGVKATEHKFLARLSESEPAKQPAIDLEKITAIDNFLEDGQQDKGYRAFVMMRRMWPQLRDIAISSGWQPIETAPQDGTEIIGIFYRKWDEDSKPTVYGPWTVAFKRGQWRSSWDGSEVIENESDFGTNYKSPDVDPTHWQPLPNTASLAPQGRGLDSPGGK